MFSKIKKILQLRKYADNPMFDRAIEAIRIEEEKKKLLNEFVSVPIKYEVIRDFVQAAQLGVVVKLTVQGVPIEIRKEEKPESNRFTSDTF